MAALLWIVAGPLAAAFLPSEEGQAIARTYWQIVPLTVAGYGITIAASAGFNGLGRPGHALVITAGRALGLVIPAVLIGGQIIGTPIGIIGGFAAANIIAGVLTVLAVMTFAPMTAKHGKQRNRSAAADREDQPT